MTKDKSWGSNKRCYHTHPPLPLGDGLVIHGGSCSTPLPTDSDVYIGFDLGMRFTNRHYPWSEGIEVRFKVTDMHAPGDPAEFKKLVTWTIEQIKAGKNVHAGCIGGHGRTGTFFAAIVAEMMGEKDAIEYVRKNYCKKAVESKAQIEFLVKHYGTKTAKPTKSHGTGSLFGDDPGYSGKGASKDRGTTGKPVKANGNIWGSTID